MPQVALGVWRDEDKGLINGRKIPDPDDPDQSDSDNNDDDDAARPTDVPVATEDERSTPAPSRGPSLPPTSASEGGFDDDFDIDAMIAEDEAARAHATSTTANTSIVVNNSRIFTVVLFGFLDSGKYGYEWAC